MIDWAVTSPIDIYRTANELIKQHGADAPKEMFE